MATPSASDAVQQSSLAAARMTQRMLEALADEMRAVGTSLQALSDRLERIEASQTSRSLHLQPSSHRNAWPGADVASQPGNTSIRHTSAQLEQHDDVADAADAFLQSLGRVSTINETVTPTLTTASGGGARGSQSSFDESLVDAIAERIFASMRAHISEEVKRQVKGALAAQE